MTAYPTEIDPIIDPIIEPAEAPAPRWFGWAVLALVLLAFAVRVAAIFALRAWEHPSYMEHHAVAVNLLEGNGFWFRDWGWVGPSSVQSPPYPLLLAASYKVFGVGTKASYVAMMLLNAAAGAVAVWLTYLLATTLGRRTPASRWAGLIGAALVAVWPTQIYAATFVQAVALITAATLGILYLWQRSLDTGHLAPWLGFCVLGCLAALTEPVLLPIMALSGLLILAWPAERAADPRPPAPQRRPAAAHRPSRHRPLDRPQPHRPRRVDPHQEHLLGQRLERQ